MAVYQCSIEHTQQGQNVVNVIGFLLGDTLGAETAADAASVANKVAIAWQARMMEALSNTLQFIQVTARGMVQRDVSGVSIISSSPGGQPGAALPTFVAGRVVFQTGTPGRAGKGRTGLPGLLEGGTEPSAPNLLVGTTRNDLQTRITGFVADLAANVPTIKPVVVSRFKGTDGNGNPIPRPGGPIASVVTSTAVLSTVGTRVSRIR